MQPKNFGSYLLGNPLSAMSVGELDRAIPLDGQPAIRLLHMLPRELVGNANTRALLLRNAKQWSSVKDLHTIGLLDSGEAEKTLFFAYEYEQGRLAIDVINGGPGLRQWVDDPAATPADLDALAARDEAAWRDAVAPLLLY